jgi:hypothetical protein
LPRAENPERLTQLITDELEKLATAYEGSRDGWRAHGYYKGRSRLTTLDVAKMTISSFASFLENSVADP